MEDFEREYVNSTAIINTYLTRATLKEAQELKKIIDEEIIYDNFRLIIDLSLCEFIDSTFLGAIVYGHKKLLQNNGRLNVIMNFEANTDLFFITSTFRLLNVFSTREDAMNGFEIPDHIIIKVAC